MVYYNKKISCAKNGSLLCQLSEFQSSEHVGQPDIIEASPTKFLNYFFNFIIYLEQQPGVPISTTVKLFGDLFKTNQCYY